MGRMTRADLTAVWHRAATTSSALGTGVGRFLARCLDGGYHPQDTDVAHDAIGITVDNVSVAYGKRQALEGLTGAFAPGTLNAVAGPNGAGKSSLLKVLAGMRPPRSGHITYSQPTAGRLAYLPQQSELDRDYPITVAELVALGAWRRFGAFRQAPDNLIKPIEETIAGVGLEGNAHRLIGELSAGQFQRALFARLILQDAAVILLDEPFAAIDEGTTAELLRLVRRWSEERRTVIAVLHDLDQVRAHFPATLLLARRCIAWGDTGTTLTADNLALARDAMRAPHRHSAGAAA